VGNSGTIVHTTNGGQTWSPQTSGIQDTLRGVSFVDNSHGWVAVRTGKVLRTADGGATWTLHDPGTGGRGGFDVDFANTLTGLVGRQ